MVMFKVQGVRNSPRPRGLARNQLDVVPTHMERSTFNYVCSDGQKAAVIARPPLPRLAALRTRDHSEDHGAASETPTGNEDTQTGTTRH
jgi:hypothetical protein